MQKHWNGEFEENFKEYYRADQRVDVKSRAKYEALHCKRDEMISEMCVIFGSNFEWLSNVAEEELEEEV